MSTPYSAVHEACLSKITDYDILRFLKSEREDLLLPYLMSACSQFKKVCKVDLLDRDDINKKFNNELTDDIIEVLAIGEVFYWLNPKVLNTENLRNSLSTKDFSTFSPANLLKELQSLRNELKKEFRQAIIEYSYANGDIANLKV